jgi:predicted RNase H-like HicB family nuclease
MKNEYTAVIQQDGRWWVGWLEEIPGVNSQGETRDELMENLRSALNEALEMNRSEARQSAGLRKFGFRREAPGISRPLTKTWLRAREGRWEPLLVGQPQLMDVGPQCLAIVRSAISCAERSVRTWESMLRRNHATRQWKPIVTLVRIRGDRASLH